MKVKNILFIATILISTFSLNTQAQQPVTAVKVVYDNSVGDDGAVDDTPSIQQAINNAIINGVNRVELDANKTYFLNSKNSQNQNGIIIWGSNLTLEGNNAILIDKRNIIGYWGESIGIDGLIKGLQYPIAPGSYTVNNQSLSFGSNGAFTGENNIQIKNVLIKNLTITHQTSPQYLNTVGITYASGVTVKNVTSNHAPQTAFAIVADNSAYPVSDVLLDHATANYSSYHSFRISLQGDANTLGVRMYQCASYNVINSESGNTSYGDGDINGRKVAVWYRAGTDSENVRLSIESSTFDDTGEIFSSQSAKNLVIKDSNIYGGITLMGSGGTSYRDNFIIANNVFYCATAKKYHVTAETPIYIMGQNHGILFRNRISGDTGSWLTLDSGNNDVTNISHYWGINN